MANPRKTKAAFLLLLLGATTASLLTLAWPRLQASLLHLPVDAAITAYWGKGSIPREELLDLQQRSLTSIAIHPHHRYWDNLSFLYFLEGIDGGNTLHQRRQAFEQCIEAAKQSLQGAPVQPRAWLRIARSQSWLSFPAQQVIGSFKMAVYTGRVEPMHLLARLALGYRYLALLDEEGKDLLRDQTLLAWRLREAELIRALKKGELKFPQLEATLAGSHDDVIVEMEEALGGVVR